ncbi:MAG: PorP/SprF family type IX secretion system membrane protein [Prevotellaceae bacterium]|jgi:type IX secretion system PorP/SprF family membrane protein|nr:PorP/SprF family type IX secretion system membrane protein [Prevotellaceae bacterium]
MKQALCYLLFLLPALSHANPDVGLNQSHTSGYLLNPAYTGLQEYTFASLQVRTQWVDMPGAPQQQYLFLEHSLVPRKAGVGLVLFNEESNVLANAGGYLTYRYSFQLSPQQRLSSALSLGLLQNRINFDRIIAENPFESSLLMTGVEHKLLFNASFGLLYSFADFLELGLVGYRLLNNSFRYESYTTGRSSTYSAIRSFAFNAQYRKTFVEDYQLGALLYLYTQQGLPVEPTLRLHFSYLPYGATLYGGYTWGNAFSVGASLWLYDRVNLGYTAEIPPPDISRYTGLTQQVSLGVRIGQPAQPRPSKVSPRDIEELRRMNQENFEHIERVAQVQEFGQRQQQSKIDSLKRELAELKQMALVAQETLKNTAITRSTADTAPALTIDLLGSAPPTVHRYVVLGYYLHRNFAERYQALLERALGLKTSIYSENDSSYYVYRKKVGSRREAREEISRLQEQYDLREYVVGNIWVLEVEGK